MVALVLRSVQQYKSADLAAWLLPPSALHTLAYVLLKNYLSSHLFIYIHTYNLYIRTT